LIANKHVADLTRGEYRFPHKMTFRKK